MHTFKNPYISRVIIKNFRNFINADVDLEHKQVVIGENNVGKSNFLKAIQLILDKNYSDNDRQLSESDFHDSINDPMINGAEIEVVIQIKGYEHNSKLRAQFDDAVISTTPPTLQFKYKFSPNKNENGLILNYDYKIYKGASEDRLFTSEDRSYLNIFVIKALRDVERELKANKNSPLYKLVQKYEISVDDLESISDEMKKASEKILELDEIVHIKEIIQSRFDSLSGLQRNNVINLRTFDIDTERLLYTLQVYMGIRERPISELSLGFANILYVSLMLLLLKDRTVMPIIKEALYRELRENDENLLLDRTYSKSDKGNYILNNTIEEQDYKALYNFMDDYNYRHQSFTILAVEEPEAHLHPILQRLIYREVLQRSDTSVIFTSHSTFIASVAPLETIVNIRTVDSSSKIYSTAKVCINGKDKKDIERYIDAKRGELYFGKGVILVEGITEEYLIPSFAKIINIPLDDYGIVLSNVNSTNFKPYIQLLNALNIPWVVFTDGDYYEVVTTKDEKTDEDIKVKKYHILSTGSGAYYRGNEIVEKIIVDLELMDEAEIPTPYDQQDILFQEQGFFIGSYTFEVDMMEKATEIGLKIFKETYRELIEGGIEMQRNFEGALDEGRFWDALKKVESNVSKGRFAQRLSESLTEDFLPVQIEKGLKAILAKVTENYE